MQPILSDYNNGATKITVDFIKYSEDNSTSETYLDDIIENPDYMTPMEFYSKVDKNAESSVVGYQEPENITKMIQIQNNYFWIESLRNWCIYDISNGNSIELKIWNGKNEFESFSKIAEKIEKHDAIGLKKNYFYNIDDIEISNTYEKVNKLGIDGMGFEMKYAYIICKRDNIFSTYNSNTMQNIHNSLMGKNIKYSNTTSFTDMKDNTPNGFAVGTNACPCIWRLSNGKMALSYVFKFESYYAKLKDDGPLMKLNIVKNATDLNSINSYCKNYFGDGKDKTIKDWKRFDMYNTAEEVYTNIKDSSEDTIYGIRVINNEYGTNDMKITFKANRPNVMVEDTDEDDYVLRWEKN